MALEMTYLLASVLAARHRETSSLRSPADWKACALDRLRAMVLSLLQYRRAERLEYSALPAAHLTHALQISCSRSTYHRESQVLRAAHCLGCSFRSYFAAM